MSDELKGVYYRLKQLEERTLSLEKVIIESDRPRVALRELEEKLKKPAEKEGPLPTTESCETCKFWRQRWEWTEPSEIGSSEKVPLREGDCRKYAPAMGEADEIDNDFWCGEWKPRGARK